jgi:hypothetical protein
MIVSLTAHRAEGIKDTQKFGRQDPYVKIVLAPSGAAQRCKQDLSGGKTPKWSKKEQNTLVLQATDSDTSMRIELWNDNLIEDDLIGRATLDLAAIPEGAPMDCALPLDTGGSLGCTVVRRSRAEAENDPALQEAIARSIGQQAASAAAGAGDGNVLGGSSVPTGASGADVGVPLSRVVHQHLTDRPHECSCRRGARRWQPRRSRGSQTSSKAGQAIQPRSVNPVPSTAP